MPRPPFPQPPWPKTRRSHQGRLGAPQRWRGRLGVVFSIGLAVQLAAVAQTSGPVAAPQTSPPLAGTPIPLPEPPGQLLLMRSGERADYGPLAENFLTQANLAYCGVASAVMLLNSLAVPAPAVAGYGPYHFWTQENVFDPPQTRTFVRPERVAREGMTLEQLHGLLASHGLVVERYHGERLSLDQFRALLRRNMETPGDRLLVNYHRQALGQAGGGHISPIAAYNARTDRVLILDVARYRYPSVWVSTTDLWRAIRTVDTSSGRSRGLITVRRGSTPPPRETAPPPGPN